MIAHRTREQVEAALVEAEGELGNLRIVLEDAEARVARLNVELKELESKPVWVYGKNVDPATRIDNMYKSLIASGRFGWCLDTVAHGKLQVSFGVPPETDALYSARYSYSTETIDASPYTHTCSFVATFRDNGGIIDGKLSDVLKCLTPEFLYSVKMAYFVVTARGPMTGVNARDVEVTAYCQLK